MCVVYISRKGYISFSLQEEGRRRGERGKLITVTGGLTWKHHRDLKPKNRNWIL